MFVKEHYCHLLVCDITVRYRLLIKSQCCIWCLSQRAIIQVILKTFFFQILATYDVFFLWPEVRWQILPLQVGNPKMNPSMEDQESERGNNTFFSLLSDVFQHLTAKHVGNVSFTIAVVNFNGEVLWKSSIIVVDCRCVS